MNLYVYNLPTILVTLLSMPVPIAVWFLFLCKCLPMKLLHKLLRKLDMVERGPEDSDEKPQSTLHGQEVPLFSVLMFMFCFSFVCSIIGMIFVCSIIGMIFVCSIIGMIFVNTLLVQRTTSCNPKVECFLVDTTVSLIKPVLHTMHTCQLQ